MNIKKITEFINIENNRLVFVIILIGVGFMLFSSGGDSKKSDTDKVSESVNVNYEERLEEILSDIKGVGSVSVMITYYSTAESDIAYESKESSSKREDGDRTKNTENNSDKQAVMSSGEPFVTKSIYPQAKGVVVVAKGVDVPSVKENVINAVTTAMGIASHRVCVVEKE